MFKKITLAFLFSLLSQAVLAGDLSVQELQNVLSSKSVVDELGTAVMASNIEIRTANYDKGASSHVLTFQVKVAGLGPNGPSQRPCHVTIIANEYDGFGIEYDKIKVTKVCAQNRPKIIR